jgi:hypothetical protein
VKINGGAVVKCNYELCVEVVNKSSIQSKTPSRVTLIHAKIYYLSVIVIEVLCVFLEGVDVWGFFL